MPTPLDRIGVKDIQPLLERICLAYQIGAKPKHSAVIDVGYEDCNIILETSKGKYVAKIFAKTRTTADIERYSAIMGKAILAGVNHPSLLYCNDEIVYHDIEGLSLVLMEFVEGQSYLMLNKVPTRLELRKVVEQAALINQIDYHPPLLFDSWAIPNIESMFQNTKKYIQNDDLKLVHEVIKRYKSIPVKKLPHCFVHGDFTKANVMRGINGNVYILDFSVSSWYPRIQELAVISANLMFDPKSGLEERTVLVREEYEKYNHLTSAERVHLYNYTLAAVAMEFMGSHQEKFTKGNESKETDYWMNLGRRGLRRALKP